MFTMPIYLKKKQKNTHTKKKHLKIYFSRTKNASRLNLGIQHRGLKGYQVDSNDVSRLNFDLSVGVVGWCEGAVYLTSPGRPTDIGLQLGKACYPCSG